MYRFFISLFTKHKFKYVILVIKLTTVKKNNNSKMDHDITQQAQGLAQCRADVGPSSTTLAQH